MVGKGHDFPQVTLSVILDADATLRTAIGLIRQHAPELVP